MTGQKQKRSLVQRIGIGVMALPFAIVPTALLGHNPRFHSILPAIFVVSLCASFLVWNWVFFDRPEELKRKLPISSKELRRKTKEFYDKLDRDRFR